MTTTSCPCGHPFREHDLGASAGIGRREVACIHCGCVVVVSDGGCSCGHQTTVITPGWNHTTYGGAR